MAKTQERMLQLDSWTGSAPRSQLPKAQVSIVVVALLVFVVGFLYLFRAVSSTQAEIYIVSGVLGLALYHAHYGFTSSFRSLVADGRGVGIRAQMILFLIANILFLPLLLHGSFAGHPVSGYVFPVGLSVLAGSFLFGIGMQLADGCASGTLYHTGGGDSRGILAIVGFVIGSVAGSWNFTWWMATPHFQPVSFLKTFGVVGGFAFNLLLLAVVFVATIAIEKMRHGKVETFKSQSGAGWSTFIKGPWTWITGSIVLAIGGAVVLALSGKPWGVTSAFALWGAKLAQPLGIPVTHWGYWQTTGNATALHSALSHDVTTVMDVGIIVGAVLAAAFAGKFPKRYFQRMPWRMFVTVLIGGILMGYGARIAFGCNIGAFFAGIASFSLHGWEWFIGALAGSAIGVLVRPFAGMKNR